MATILTAHYEKKVERKGLPSLTGNTFLRYMDFAKTLNAKDAFAATNLYYPDATLLPPNEPIVSGSENILAYWQGAIEAGAANVSVTTI